MITAIQDNFNRTTPAMHVNSCNKQTSPTVKQKVDFARKHDNV